MESKFSKNPSESETAYSKKSPTKKGKKDKKKKFQEPPEEDELDNKPDESN